MTPSSSLRSGPVPVVLERLHAAAKGDRVRFLGLAPRLIAGKLRGRPFFEVITPEAMRAMYIPVSPEQGRLLYLKARELGACNVVEFGTSFGISTIYLAAAVKDNGGGCVVGSEIEPSKHARAVANLKEAGLETFADVRLGDALETLKEVPQPVDLVLLDGWKDLYLPVLKLLTPRLRRGAVVMADNIFTFRKDLRPYVEYMQSGENGFESTTLRIADGFEYSVYVGGGD
jgi:predicted O-methyltransferase YrrM